MALTPEVRVSQGDGLVVTSNPPTISLKLSQVDAFAIYNTPTLNMEISQVGFVSVTKAGMDIRASQAHVHVVVISGEEQHNLRAWTFTQDDHDFYVLRLGTAKTLVFDKLTAQWAEWKSPGYNYWRGEDGCDWEGFNVACDPLTGKIWKIDADGRLDYNTTPIVSQIFGGMTQRFRTFTPCFMAEVALSDGNPPDGIDPTTVGIRLRTSDTLSWTDHGTLQGQAEGTQMYARFYGLGLMKSPGILFEITDYGYARRIDGLMVEMGGVADNG